MVTQQKIYKAKIVVFIIDKIDAGLMGAIMGIIVTLGVVSYHSPDVSRAEIFQRENKPAIMRIYRPQASDGIYITDSKNKNIYDVPLKQHLETITNKADREIEEVLIKKAVGWYDE